MAERAERELSDLQPSDASRPHVRRADYEPDEDGEECFQAWTSPQRPRQRPPQPPPPDNRHESGADRRRFRCGEPGHLARDCPASAPQARPSCPAGNYVGAAQLGDHRSGFQRLSTVGALWLAVRAAPGAFTSAAGSMADPARPWWTLGRPSPWCVRSFFRTPPAHSRGVDVTSVRLTTVTEQETGIRGLWRPAE